MITLEEIEKRIHALKLWCAKVSLDHYLYWTVKKEMDEYVKLRRTAIELKTPEINNQVKTDYYQQLENL